MYQVLLYTHLGTVLAAFPIGGWLLLNPKGTRVHRWLGKPYMALMFSTALISLALPATVGPSLLGHFGLIHLLSVLVLFNVVLAILAIKQGNVRSHRNHMVGVYLGGIVVAGIFAFMPGRFMHELMQQLLFG